MSTPFPNFRDGDVFISIGEDAYCLHSEVLMVCSPSLEGVLKRILSKYGGSVQMIYLVLEISPRIAYGRLTEEIVQSDEDSDTFLGWPETVRAIWRDIFKCFYDEVLDFKDVTDRDMIEHCWGLVDVADDIQMKKDMVAWAINRAAWALDQRLYYLISQEPVNWLKLARRIRLAWLYQESVVHVVGQWNNLNDDEFDYVHGDTQELCEGLHEDLQQEKRRALQAMMEHRPVAHDNPQINRWACNYGAETHMTVAVSIYREWLSRELEDRSPLQAADGGASFFRNVANEKPNNQQHNTVPTSEVDLNLPAALAPGDVLEIMRVLKRVKGDMKAYATKFMRSRSQYDPDILGDLPYLTCCGINENDCPWFATRDDSEGSVPTSVSTEANGEVPQDVGAVEVPETGPLLGMGTEEGPAQAPDPVSWGIDAMDLDRQLLSDRQLEQILEDIQAVYPGQRPPGEMDIDLDGPGAVVAGGKPNGVGDIERV